MWRMGLLLHETHPEKILSIFIYVFNWLYLVQFFYFFSIYWSMSWYLCSVFDAISSSTDETLHEVSKYRVISGLYFPVFGLNTEIYFVNRRSTHSEILSMNSTANVFAFGDFDVHHNDSLTYSDGTDRLYLFYRGFLLIRKSWSSFLAQFLLAFLQIQKWCSFLLYRWW